MDPGGSSGDWRREGLYSSESVRDALGAPLLVSLVFAALSLSAASHAAYGQALLTGVGDTVHLVNADQAILGSQIERTDLPCSVEPIDPALGFDLRFHAGYEVEIPLDELAKDGNQLAMLMRVTPKERPRDAVYLFQNIAVPRLAPDADGKTQLAGIFDVGEGEYHVDWMLRDRSERVCSFYWDAKAELSGGDSDLEVELAPGTVAESALNQFGEEPPVSRNAGRLLNVKLLVNFAPQDQKSSVMGPIDTLALVTMLRRISREPRFGQFSVAAFNIQDQKVVYRQNSGNRIDFPALGRAIEDIEPGTVDLSLLANKHGEVEFLVELIRIEMSDVNRPDALIFAGPKYLLDDSVPEEELEALSGGVDFPVFYLNYNTIPQQVPWRDAIGNAIRVFDGKEFTITRPRDLFFAVTEMVDHIIESNQREPDAASVLP